MVRIIMHGANGKMGRTISELLDCNDNCTIVAGIDKNTDTYFDYPVFDSLEECILEADVIIDFSTASAVDSMLDWASAHRMPVVLCTTGLSSTQIQKVEQTANQIPIFFSANMSLGINLLINLVQKAASILYPADFDIEIVEKHHNQKIDSPSGTALYIANSINQSLDNQCSLVFDRSAHRKPREKSEIGVYGVRGGTIVGQHDVIFAGQDEVLEIRHTAYSKEIFATGAINAATYLITQPAGLYDMSNLIDNA